MFEKKRKLIKIRNQQDMLMHQMEKLPADTDEYRKLHEEYAKFLEEEEKLLKSGRWFERILQVLGLGISIGGTFIMPMWLANKAVSDDENMKLVNHRVTNLIGKVFTRKE